MINFLIIAKYRGIVNVNEKIRNLQENFAKIICARLRYSNWNLIKNISIIHICKYYIAFISMLKLKLIRYNKI